MALSKSGLHDRRGYDPYMKGALMLIPVSLGILIFYSWKIGLALLLTVCVVFITLESVSAPPANRPEVFQLWSRRQNRRRPVLLCLGDSLTHGTCSSTFTPDIPEKLCAALGKDPPPEGFTFADPLWVVNAGQNCITTHTILNERLNKALGTYPDYIMILIGTNDILATYKPSFAKSLVSINELPEVPNLEVFERNLKNIISFIRQSSPMVQIGLCTLPPLGEDLKAHSNKLVRDANAIVEQVAQSDERCAVIPLYERLESMLEKKHGKSLPVDYYLYLGMIMNPLYHMMGVFFSWDRLAKLFGNTVLTDGVHLSDTGREMLVDLVVEWLLNSNVAKAIAVKS